MAEATKFRLARVLCDERLKSLSEKARTGYYDDFESPLATPIVQLVQDLRKANREDLAKRAMNGEWDGSKEEGDAWFQREGRHLLA